MNVKVLLATILSVAGLTLAPVLNATAATYQIDGKQLVDKSVASRGDTLNYTVSITNVGDTAIDPVFIAETFSPYVDYVAGSTSWTDSLGASGSVVDAWLNDGLNLGKLNPSEWVKVTFQAKVKGSVADGALVESVVQIKKTWKRDEAGNPVNEWFQCAAQTTVKVGQVLGAELPETGPENVIATSLLLGYLGFLVRRIKLTRYF